MSQHLRTAPYTPTSVAADRHGSSRDRSAWWRTVICVFGLSATLLVGCARTPGSTVRLGYLPITFDLPVFVAMDRGYFKDAGLSIKAVEMKSSNEAMNAIISGDLDLQASIGIPTLLTVQEKEPDQFHIVLSGEETKSKYGGAILVLKASPLTSAADLKGKRIGIYTGLTHVLNAKIVLRKLLDPEKDITIVQVEPRLQLQALQSGQFDALFTIEPYPTIAVLQDLGRVLVANPRVTYVMDPFPVAATIVSPSFVRNHTKDVKSLIKALNRAVDFIESNEAEARVIMDKYLRLGPEVAHQVRLYRWTKLGSENRPRIRDLATLFRHEGLIAKDIEVDRMFLAKNQD